MNFDFFYIKGLEKSKMALTFAYDIGKKRIIYQNDRGKKLHPNCPRQWRQRPVTTARRSGRCCRQEARARWIYGAAASNSGTGGGIDRRRRDFAAAARWEMEGVGAGGNFQPFGYSRVRQAMPRAVADASHLALGIVQNTARPKIFTAPRRLPRLLEERFRLRALQISG